MALIDFCIQLIVILFSFVLGVDVVLNSLSEEKLQASLQVLAQHGRFLEIGKYDLSNNTGLGTADKLINSLSYMLFEIHIHLCVSHSLFHPQACLSS